MPPCPLRPSLVAACAAVGLVSVAAAQPAALRPSWECLPADTVVMIRVPRPAAFMETLRTRTKFGAVALDADRVERLGALAVEAWGGPAGQRGSVAELEERLAEFGLERRDVAAAFAGDMGYGIVTRARGDDLPPVTLALAWMEPGAEVAERLVAAFQRRIAADDDAERPPQRVDLEMAGHQVTQASWAIMRPDLGAVEIEGDLDPDRLAKLREDLAARAKQAPQVEVGTSHAFVTRIGGRLLAAQTLASPTALGAGMPGERAGAAADLDRMRDGDGAREIFARYLAAHGTGDGSPLADILREPAVQAALPAGEPLLEIVVNTPSVLATAAGAGDAAARRLAAAGVADIGPLAVRMAFDAGRFRQGAFLALPAPRAGVMRILDQACDAPDVPSFVSGDAVGFTQVSLDLAAAYRTVKEFATADGGEQTANMFMTAEMQARGWLGVDLEAMLANLGSRHWIVTYEPQVAAAIEAARRDRPRAPGDAPVVDRNALVWKLADDAPVVALLPKVAALAQTQVVEEQGFQGVRFPGGTVAVFVGQGHLVVGMGGDALERTLAGIRNPPAAAASFREGDVPRTAAELVTLGPARLVSYADATRTGGILGTFREMVAATPPEDVPEEYRDLYTKLQALLPSAEEMRGMFGVAASVVRVNDAGIVTEAAWDMPPP